MGSFNHKGNLSNTCTDSYLGREYFNGEMLAMMLSDGLLSDDFTVDFTQVMLLVEMIKD